MTPLQAAIILLALLSIIGLVLSSAQLLGYRPRGTRPSQRPTLRYPKIPVEFETGEWDLIPPGRS